MLITWKYKLVKCKRPGSKFFQEKKIKSTILSAEFCWRTSTEEKKSFLVVCQVLFLCNRMQNYSFSKKWSEIGQEANCNQETLYTRITQSTDFSCFNRNSGFKLQLSSQSFPLCPNNITIQITSYSNEYSKHVSIFLATLQKLISNKLFYFLLFVRSHIRTI